MSERPSSNASGPSESPIDLDVAVVGAGAVGSTVAYDLARRGCSVTLYDRENVASGSSGRAAGVCYAASPAPLDAKIAVESIERFRLLSGDDTFPFEECPYVFLARGGDERRAAAIRSSIERMQAVDLPVVAVDGEELGERFPALRTDDVAIAGIAGAAGYTEPSRYAACMAAASTGVGATLETHSEVAVETDPLRIVRRDTGNGGSDRTDQDYRTDRSVDAVVVAAGAHTRQVLASAGIPIAMKPYRVQALTAGIEPAPRPRVDLPMCYDATDGFYCRPHPTGILAGNGTETVEADPDGYDRAANDGFADELTDRLDHRIPEVVTSVAEAWAGLCTATPDGDPLVGECESGLYVATGFQGHGFMRAPAIGRRIAEQVTGGDGIEAFDPTRFDGTEDFEIVEGMAIERSATE